MSEPAQVLALALAVELPAARTSSARRLPPVPGRSSSCGPPSENRICSLRSEPQSYRHGSHHTPLALQAAPLPAEQVQASAAAALAARGVLLPLMLRAAVAQRPTRQELEVEVAASWLTTAKKLALVWLWVLMNHHRHRNQSRCYFCAQTGWRPCRRVPLESGSPSLKAAGLACVPPIKFDDRAVSAWPADSPDGYELI